MRRIGWLDCCSFLGAWLVVLVIAGGAGAATVTVGSPLTATFTLGPCSTPCTLANTALTEPGALAASPIDGVVIRWRMLGGTSEKPYELRVLRPQEGAQFAGAGTSAPETATSSAIQTFQASLPIHAGDLIGIDFEGTIGTSANTGSYAYFGPPLPDGVTEAPVGTGSTEIAVNADVQPPPGIAAVTPSQGSIEGGTSVTIGGHDFSGARAVAFGSTPATSFTVNSDSSITAVSPPASAAGTVDVNVTTAAGTTATSAADRFTYVATGGPVPRGRSSCVVPKLKGRKLKQAKRKLKKAHCKLGKVRGHRSKRARVRKQSARPGKVLPRGSKINVKVG
jgi:hypothetical protein